mmetsp:Transcript_30589/g.57233  ORF Transcript_30589/g.57233 Transcript_30589/m.57233 type:complete len:246 (-) Transcript_30589:202-939(-)
MALPFWLEGSLGTVGAICFALMLVPQVVLNTKRRSTEGLSWGLVVPWHVAGILFVGVTVAAERPQWFSALSMFSQAFCCGICEVQMVAFRRCEKGCQRRLWMSVAYVAVTVVSVALCAGAYAAFLALPATADFIVGDLIPSALIGLGFFPEFWEFISSRSIEGYSFGVTALDVIGSAANAMLFYAREDEPMATRSAHAAPFLTIIVMHVVLVALAVWVVRHPHPQGIGEKAVGVTPSSSGEAESV